MQVQLLRYLIRVGEAAAKVRPELAIRFELPSLSTAPKHFLSSVRAMLSQAETEWEFLLSVGLSELALTDLKREVGEFEEAIEASHTGRRGRCRTPHCILALLSRSRFRGERQSGRLIAEYLRKRKRA